MHKTEWQKGWILLPGDNWYKKSLIGGVVNPIPKREVQAVVLPSTSPNVPINRTFSV